jgi:flagellin
MTSSINTNSASQIALEDLSSTQRALNATQKQVSTGYIVADALDNGAIFGIAQSVRSNITGVAAANQELGNFSGLVQTANAGATAVSNVLSDIRATLTHLADAALSTTQVAQYQQQYNNYVAQLTTYVQGSTYGGLNLLSNGSGLSVVQDGNADLLSITGTQYNVNSGLFGISTAGTAITNYTVAGSVLLTTFGSVLGSVATVLNFVGDLNLKITTQQTFNQNLSDALNVGLGALVDADLAKASASLTALQIKQQLGTQSLSIANQAPNVLLSLFK